jgi:hypothetical protein
MNINLEKLNQLNQENVATPGKIAAVLDDTEEIFIYSVEEFDASKHELLITQIWTSDQEKLVRKKIEFLSSGDVLSHFDTQELIRLYEMLLAWVGSVEYSITVSD